MKRIIFALCTVTILASTVPTFALTRYVVENPFYRRTAITAYGGFGLPVGEFSDNREGDGNHRSGAFDWTFDIEHFFNQSVSLGASVSASKWEDKDFPELETQLNNYGGFLRWVALTKGPIHPYLRLGVGSTRVQFQNEDERLESLRSGSLQIGGGAVLVVARSLGISMQGTYNHGFTQDKYIKELDNTIVGFDTKYWSFGAGISIFLP